MFHPVGVVRGVLEERVDTNKGPNGCCILSMEFYETDLSRGFVRGYNMQVVRGTVGPLATAINGLRSGDIPWGPGHHKKFASRFDQTVAVNISCEDLPEESNQVTIDPDLVDSNGIPAPKIAYRLSENSKRMLAHGLSRGEELMHAAGAKEVIKTDLLRAGGWHLLGTARMGNDPKTSVVNSWGRAHDVRNLFIVDGSVFVTAGGVNPTSTIQAVALYIGDAMKRNLANLFD